MVIYFPGLTQLVDVRPGVLYRDVNSTLHLPLYPLGPVKEYPRGSLAQNDLHRKFLIERYIHAWQTSMRVFSCKLPGSTLELTQLAIEPEVCVLKDAMGAQTNSSIFSYLF